MALSEVVAPHSEHRIMLGVDPSTGRYYPIPVDPATGTVAVSQASASSQDEIAHNQVSVGTGGSLIVAARANRNSVLIVNHGTTAVYLGNQNVGTADGLLLAGVVGASVSIPGGAAIYGKVATGSQTVSYLEVY